MGVGGGAVGGGTSAGGAGTSDGPADVIAAGVRWVGRVDISNPSQPAFSYSQSGFLASFTGTGVTVDLTDTGDAYFTAVVDKTVHAMLHGGTGNVTVTAASGLTAGVHTLEFYRQTESSQAGVTTLKAIHVTDGTLGTPPSGPKRLIEIIGDSISCGYGDLCTSNVAGFQTSQESAYDTWGAIAARSLGADLSIVAVSGIGVYQDNTGSKTNTMPNVYGQTHYSPSTPAWGFEPKPQAVVINLGTNDFASADPGKTNYEGAMLALVRTVRSKYPDAFIFLTIGPMVSDGWPTGVNSYTNCTTYLRDVVTQSNDAKVSYFALEQQTSSDYGCDYHPNVGRQKIMGDAAAAAIRAKLPW
jgi:lysophospholipase L1-like esterase